MGKNKPTKRSLTRKLDKLISEMVRARGYCAWCHKTDGLETAHIFSRKYRNLRWNLTNLLCLCHTHHFFAHSNPILFAEFVKDYLGETKYNLLKLQAKSIKKWTLGEMMELYETLKEDKLKGV